MDENEVDLRLHQSEIFTYFKNKRDEKSMAQIRSKQDKENLNDRLTRIEKDLKLEQQERTIDIERARIAFLGALSVCKVEKETLNQKLEQVERDFKLEVYERQRKHNLICECIAKMKDQIDEINAIKISGVSVEPISNNTLQEHLSDTREHLELLEGNMKFLFEICIDYASVDKLVNMKV